MPTTPDLDRLKRLRPDMEKCFRCSLCKMVPLPTVTHADFTDACPAARQYHYHAFSGSGKQLMAMSLLDGRCAADPALARIAFACCACGYCDVACKFIMDAERHRVNMTLREHLSDQGLAPEPLRNAPVGRTGPAVNWAEGLGLKVLPAQKAETLIFAGCATDDPRSAAIARKLARLLQSAGLDLGVMDDEPCCGLPAYWMNRRGQFTEIAAQNALAFERLGVKRVVTVSGSCLGAFRSKYPEYARALGIEVVHATEVLAELVSDGRLKLERPVMARVTYHDPCYLGRQSEPFIEWHGQTKTALGVMTYTEPPKPINYGTRGVFDPPRTLLRAIPGLDFREMYRIREYAFCCGGGGGVPLAYPELARSATLHRLEEARAVGADRLVTACSHCERQFAAAQSGDEAMPVLDIIELVHSAAGLPE
jgi:Fe-S oxidoreductase